jgi:signal transduction histidine kinase
MLGLRIDGLRAPAAALIALGADPAPSGALLSAAGPILAALLDRETQLRHDLVTGAVERRLARLRFDLHDGPQQDVHLLAQDLRLFRDQLRSMIAGDPDQDRALGRLDDLEAQLIALDDDLRRLSTSVQSPFLTSGSLRQALQQLTDAFAQRTGITPEIELHGDLTQLSDSRQIAVLSLVREALSNIRKHSDAESVRILIAPLNGSVTVEVSDDGSGFDPEAMLARSSRAGRLGLVGMHERVRMLGGRTQIESKPGGPTIVSATLPPWPSADE